MLPNTIHTDNEAPEDMRDRKEYLRSLIMSLTDDECYLLLDKWENRMAG